MSMWKGGWFRLGAGLGFCRLTLDQPPEVIRDVIRWGGPCSSVTWVFGVRCRRDRLVSRVLLRGPLVLILAHAAGL